MATVSPVTATATGAAGYLRLTSCPRCGGRRRSLVEAGTHLRGTCLGCGVDLSAPLAIELLGRVSLVGPACITEARAGRSRSTAGVNSPPPSERP